MTDEYRARVSAPTRDGAALFGLALAFFYFQAWAWPLHQGRTFGTYVGYYVDFFKADPTYYFTMVFRTPLAPFFIGWANALGGPVLLEALQAVLWSTAVVLAYRIGLNWGRRAALCTGVALLLYPPFAHLFHEVSSDALFGFGFLAWCWWSVKTLIEPSRRRFAVCGVGLFLLVMTRPSSQILLAFALVPFALTKVSLLRRLSFSSVFLVVSLSLLMGWALHNYVRYQDFTISRGANACVPLYRLWMVNRAVDPGNGPASRQLADAVRRDLLVREPYVSYGITEQQFFSCGSFRMWADLPGLSDRVWGWDSDHRHLQRVAMEALAVHGVPYAKDLVLDWFRIMTTQQAIPPVKRATEGAPPARTIVVHGRTLPMPTEGEPIPNAYCNFTQTNPSCEPVSPARQQQLTAAVKALGLTLPRRDGSDRIAQRLRECADCWPPMLAFLLIGGAGLIIHPPRFLTPLLVAAGLAMLIVVITLSGMMATYEYRVPVDPLFIIFGIIGGARLGAALKVE